LDFWDDGIQLEGLETFKVVEELANRLSCRKRLPQQRRLAVSGSSKTGGDTRIQIGILNGFS
jgi:hypothetical protein